MRLERGSAASPLSKGSDRRWPIGSKNTPVRKEGRGRRVRTTRDGPGSADAEDHTRRAGDGAASRRRGAHGRPRKRGATDHPFEPDSGSDEPLRDRRSETSPEEPFPGNLSSRLPSRDLSSLRRPATKKERARPGGVAISGETRPSNGLPLVSSSGPQGPSDGQESTTGGRGHNRNPADPGGVRDRGAPRTPWGQGPAPDGTAGSLQT